jgi:lysophospholipase L1-like esterase
MFDCLIIGDSIGKGISDVRKDCVAYVQNGINSREWNRKFFAAPLGGSIVVISLGTNDTRDISTQQELLKLRAAVNYAERVLWILPPIKPWVRDAVLLVADRYGDDVIEPTQLSSDGVHPTSSGYRALGKQF